MYGLLEVLSMNYAYELFNEFKTCQFVFKLENWSAMVQWKDWWKAVIHDQKLDGKVEYGCRRKMCAILKTVKQCRRTASAVHQEECDGS